MKKLLIGALALIASLCAGAQQLPPLPTDTAVISGVLPNGLTYFIRHNETPKGQADFHIAQKVGSVLEEENQRGLAHFLEHMCFNGTKNFPGNSLVDYLESIGVKFGAHLNAYTGADETVYKITNVPTARTEVTDSVLLVLHDWANELLLSPEEIDKERGVIHEEWRTNQVGQMRILEEALPKVFPGSQYAHRLPIGTMEVIDHFPYQALRDYYEKWYRPDLQGIIVSGDIDPMRTEQVIKEMFADIEMPANPAPRIQFNVPDTPGTIYSIGSDKEMPNSIVYLIFKHAPLPLEWRNTQAQLVQDYIETMIDMMLNSRFSEMMSDPTTPFAFAQSTIDDYLMTSSEQMFAVIAAAKDGDIAKTLQSIYREVLRAKRGGFTQSEYDRAKAEFLATLDRNYNNRATTRNATYTQDMIRHFIDGTPMLDIELEYQIMKQIAQMYPLEKINETYDYMTGTDNRVVLCMLPSTVALPTEKQLDDMMKSVDAEEIEVFTDNVREDPLIPIPPVAGKITMASPVADFADTEMWMLSNGAKVFYKYSDTKPDEIVFSASAPCGLSQVYTSTTPANALALEVFANTFGIGTYSNADLSKYLSGKKVGFEVDHGLYSTQFSGLSTPKDLATLFELIYGYFTMMNYPESEFEAMRSLQIGLLENQEMDPQFIFGKDLREAMYTSPYQQVLTAQELKDCTRQGVEDLAKSRVQDASQWSFTFVGNFDKEELMELTEKYLASLPGTGLAPRRVDSADPIYEIKGGRATETFTTPMQTPQTWCAVVETATVPFTSVNAKLASIVGQILSARLIKTVREEMGAVYSIGASGNVNPEIGRNATVMTAFPMNPEKKQEVLKAIADEFTAMAKKITPEELSKVKEYLVKSYTESKEQNSAWAAYINRWTLTGKNLLSNAVDEVGSITPEMVQNFVKEMNAQGNYRVVLLDPQP
ncbi:MAG: insulinase family protein [Bacteroides sp.]|nr:insulinase family protein [Bacteroides sp.]MCM1379413.1 insulinase family protein [Bacteroides sp.]MCM1445273.1 insulinase family protein [Prevotella sp.]